MPRVLIVDDDPQGLYMLEALLKGHGYEVETAVNGSDALEKARSNPPDLIISDFFMPTMDGFALCRECKKDNTLKDVPFIAYTATYTDPKDEELALCLGAARFLVKPIEPEVLLHEVEQVLADAKAGRLPPLRESVRTEQYLREYNEALIRKLEAKVAQLHKTNRALQEEMIQRRSAEDSLAKYSQDLEQSNRDLQQFAYVASHDLQEPLRMVSSFLQLLVQRIGPGLDQKAKEYVGFAVDGAMRMKDLVDGLLAYSRVGSRGQLMRETSVQAVLEAALANLKASVDETNAAVTHDPLPSIQADATQLTQLFQNLIGNAIKFRKEGRPEVHIGAKQQEGEWLFSVRDNGIGIDQQFQERIFVIFQRLNPRQQFPGTGIGLAISKRIVERHHGRIWVDSAPGQGSTFYFTISTEGQKENLP